ncbi:NrfD/PsrC family molybdoenzyme membrane anchor subunit [Desulfobulbus oligotrophicus]|jgi:molybdopterin-containing oxidoreductase family membrane subunit|uniref:Polysulfide reductase NrfD n=1 Tax=Desulfobulbus oligotrophicus TaxID=1909699 RepID=A0A7T5VDT0_9BACT|nr:NrfD/PsrC family molybdoenzyme membrane anchor subunit [Desulfobulbus oligotrophicus]MDY0389306.1 NrfD/PsrC family molybdoenzyme membrane anchor subunit [Desulfobulbus oligotrophicus]QQG66043.1 polysulfide reductase NrfD [Desulfobulbus oligotrophicus]
MARQFSLDITAEPEVANSLVKMMSFFFGLMLLVGVGVGLAGFIIGHEHIFNNTREVPWGLLISTYAFFAITSTGLCLLAAISHIFGGNKLAPLANRMVWISLITILSGFLVIGMEIENPWRMAIYNVISPNVTSNIWWMGTLYGMALGFILLEFWLILTEHYTLALVLGVFGALAEVAANTCLGGVFSTLAARPFWYGAQMPVLFLACAFLSGAAAAIFFTHLAYIIRRRQMEPAVFAGVQAAGKVLLLMIVLVAVGVFWRMASFYVGGVSDGRVAADAFFKGPMSISFWGLEVGVGLAAPVVLLVLTRMKSLFAMSAAALMSLVGMFVARLNMVTGGQFVPQYLGYDDLPTYLDYTPSGWEWIVVLAGIGFTGIAFLQGERFFGKRFTEHDAH